MWDMIHTFAVLAILLIASGILVVFWVISIITIIACIKDREFDVLFVFGIAFFVITSLGILAGVSKFASHMGGLACIM